MKITETASGKSKIKMSKKEWEGIGNRAGWIKEAELTLSSFAIKLEEAAYDFVKQKANIIQLLFVIKDIAFQENNRELQDVIIKAINADFPYKMKFITEISRIIEEGERIQPKAPRM